MSSIEQPWVEKYRPRTLSEVVAQSEIIRRLQAFVRDPAMPHLIFAGPAGTGKTTSALALVRDLQGEHMKRNATFMELNASDARGINVIRTTVKDFARIQPPPGVPFKVLILDEADNMTSFAQQALRRTMENFTRNCRFILICNYSNKIILPIQSRCAMFRFSKLAPSDIIARVRYVAECEHVVTTPEGMDALEYVSNGDLRRAVNYLQACSTISGAAGLTRELVYRIAGKIHPRDIQQMLIHALQMELAQAKGCLDRFLRELGLSGRNIVQQCRQEVVNLEIPERLKVSIIKILAEIDYRLSEGGTEDVQMNALISQIVLLAAQAQS
jgi:replication factor C small subunit